MHHGIRQLALSLSTCAVLGALGTLPVAAQAEAPHFELLQTIRLGGSGGWDYLSYDETTDRLFISRSTHVQVVDAASGRVIGDIADTPGVHGIAVAEGMDKAYTSNGRDNSLTVFSPSTLKTLGRIATPEGIGPDFIAFDAAARQILAFNAKSHNATLVDAVSDRVVHTVALAGKPEAAVADGKGHVFVDIEDQNAIQVIDTRAGQVSATWPLPGCDEPASLALDAASHHLFVGCHNKTLLVVDADSGKTVASVGIGDGVDAGAFDAGRRLAFSSQGDGSLSIVQGEGTHYRLVQTVQTQAGARTLALDAKHHRVFLVTAEFEAPAPGASSPRRAPKPESFSLLVVGKKP